MMPAISLIGAPASGKSTLIEPYQDRSIQLGEYTKTLPETDPLKKHCHEHWEAGTIFCKKLVEDLFVSYPLPEVDWVMLDGTPRDTEQLPMLHRMFDMKGYVIITVDDIVWEERAYAAAQERTDRYDSEVAQLLKRKQEYEGHMRALEPQLSPRYQVDNSGDIAQTRLQLDEVIQQILRGE